MHSLDLKRNLIVPWFLLCRAGDLDSQSGDIFSRNLIALPDLSVSSQDGHEARNKHIDVQIPDHPIPDYYYYQAADGQLLYLHPANMQCLTQMFGQPNSWPVTIEAKIVEIEDLVQAQATRKRYRHLAHIPITGTPVLNAVTHAYI